MFQAFGLKSSDKDKPTPYELERLRKTEYTARLNNFILEAFDLVTDFAFALVLLSQVCSG
jgi:hypothetical protein